MSEHARPGGRAKQSWKTSTYNVASEFLCELRSIAEHVHRRTVFVLKSYVVSRLQTWRNGGSESRKQSWDMLNLDILP